MSIWFSNQLVTLIFKVKSFQQLTFIAGGHTWNCSSYARYSFSVHSRVVRPYIHLAVNSRALYQLNYWGLFFFYIIFYNVACDIHSLKLIVSSLLCKVLNNSFCTFKSSLFLPLAALTFSAVNSRLLTFYTYFKFSIIVKQKRVDFSTLFLFWLLKQGSNLRHHG